LGNVPPYVSCYEPLQYDFCSPKRPKKLLLSTKHPGREVKLGGPRAGENHIESFRKVLGFARLNLFVHEFLRLVGSGMCSEFIEIPGQGA